MALAVTVMGLPYFLHIKVIPLPLHATMSGNFSCVLSPQTKTGYRGSQRNITNNTDLEGCYLSPLFCSWRRKTGHVLCILSPLQSIVLSDCSTSAMLLNSDLLTRKCPTSISDIPTSLEDCSMGSWPPLGHIPIYYLLEPQCPLR